GPAAADSTGATASRTVSRIQLNADGTDTVVDQRRVTVSVSQTKQLRGRQQLDVTWSGARPTGGIVADPNSPAASLQEYPFVVLECRGVDSDTAPAASRLTPEGCWTQTPDERFQEDFLQPFPAWRVDRYAPAGERTHAVNAPPGPNTCDLQAASERFVPFVDAAGKTYYEGANGLCGIPPEASTSPDPTAPPANTTYGATAADGTGRARFVVWTAEENSSLGCSATVACALVIVPVEGVSCDVTAAGLPAGDRPTGTDATTAAANCQGNGVYAPGEQVQQSKTGYLAVTGALWWSASNWRNRMTIPLTFAPAGNACDILDTSIPVDLYGSELMAQATGQWAPAFCNDPKRFHFRHVRVGELQAKLGLASGSINAALISRPPDGGYAKPTVTAPVAVTGFAVSYLIDDQNQHETGQLRLNARLLAKLLAESYYAFVDLHNNYVALAAAKNCASQCAYAAMKNNPQDITADPEFRALNPGLLGTGTVQHEAAATLLALSGDSDVIWALTSYLNADPDARAWLDGKPDPWGMVVNPAYKGIALPVTAWPLLDAFHSPTFDLPPGCLPWDTDDKGNRTTVQQPVLPLVAAPMASLTAIVQALQFAIDNTVQCSAVGVPPTLVNVLGKRGRQPNGHRFMLGVTSIADADFYGLNAAALQSTPGHYVAPGNGSLETAVRLSTFDSGAGYWPISYAKLRTAAGAYPGTMVVYLAVPTIGLDSTPDAKGRTLAAKLGQFLRFAAAGGQQPGVNQGQLPPGYLPMTAGDGLGAYASYTVLAAGAVERQRGELVVSTQHSGGGSGSSGSSGSGGSASTGGTPNNGANPALTTSRAPDLPAWTPGVQTPRAYTADVRSAWAAWALPVLLLLSLVAAAAAGAVRVVATTRATAAIGNRLRRLYERDGR
ncbi:MAG TPA: hypothetical protein VJT31_19260, partial [Rugosimonospora sp.]|nr:hypothetical protein [Rugosimonospora sp.]